MRLLDRYRLSFTEAYGKVVGTVRKELALEPTGRSAKSTTSISEKLRRESIRLTQIQDIAGCRLVTSDIVEQDRVVEALMRLFDGATVVDRREKSSHGYRAVHVIATSQNRLVEIQVRTELQHLWAELSEKLSDIIDPAIKYGGGGENRPRILDETSEIVAETERVEMELARMLVQQQSGEPEDPREEKLQTSLRLLKSRLFKLLRAKIEEAAG